MSFYFHTTIGNIFSVCGIIFRNLSEEIPQLTFGKSENNIMSRKPSKNGQNGSQASDHTIGTTV